MRAIYLGKDKPAAVAGLEHLRDRGLRGNGGPVADAVTDIDLVLSFLFWRRIREPLITLPAIGCVNLHPAPLPRPARAGGVQRGDPRGPAGLRRHRRTRVR